MAGCRDGPGWGQGKLPAAAELRSGDSQRVVMGLRDLLVLIPSLLHPLSLLLECPHSLVFLHSSVSL